MFGSLLYQVFDSVADSFGYGGIVHCIDMNSVYVMCNQIHNLINRICHSGIQKRFLILFILVKNPLKFGRQGCAAHIYHALYLCPVGNGIRLNGFHFRHRGNTV